MSVTQDLAQQVGVSTACQALDVSRSSYYRAQQPKKDVKPRPAPARALKSAEQEAVCQELNSPRFQDCAPREVYATLLDEGTYLCSWRTMYRVLQARDQVRERRNQLSHPTYAKPELLAIGPNQLWSWDLTKLRGPVKWTYFHLYTVLDVYSRYVVGWLIANQESASLAKQLIAETCRKQGIHQDQLTLHADRGSSMRSKTIALLLADLGVTKTHSRPHVSNDNPYSEAQFKTMKYRPDYPDRFGSLEDARAWARSFFTWYNHQHHHSGLGLLTPSVVHHGQADEVIQRRQQVLEAAYVAHPERFVHGAPTAPRPPDQVWINKPPSS